MVIAGSLIAIGLSGYFLWWKPKQEASRIAGEESGVVDDGTEIVPNLTGKPLGKDGSPVIAPPKNTTGKPVGKDGLPIVKNTTTKPVGKNAEGYLYEVHGERIV